MLTSFEMKQLLCYNFMMDEKEKRSKDIFLKGIFIIYQKIYIQQTVLVT